MATLPDIVPEVVHIRTWETFWSDKGGDPFRACTACSKPFGDQTPQYLIEKEYERREPGGEPCLVYELAMCESCVSDLEAAMFEAQGHASTVAASSRHELDELLDKRAAALLAGVRDTGKLDVREWISNCLLTGEPVSLLSRYRVIAHGFGHWMVMAAMPCVLSGEALRRLQDARPQEAVDAGRRFLDERLALSLPPGVLPVACNVIAG